MWLPFAKLGSTYLEDVWEFVTDTSVYLFARHAGVAGVVAMHHFQPSSREESYPMATADEDVSGEFFDTEPSEPKQIRARRNDPCPCGSGKKFKKCHGA